MVARPGHRSVGPGHPKLQATWKDPLCLLDRARHGRAAGSHWYLRRNDLREQERAQRLARVAGACCGPRANAEPVSVSQPVGLALAVPFPVAPGREARPRREELPAWSGYPELTWPSSRLARRLQPYRAS